MNKQIKQTHLSVGLQCFFNCGVYRLPAGRALPLATLPQRQESNLLQSNANSKCPHTLKWLAF